MNNILIFGHKSFIAKNFISDYSDKFKIYLFKKYFKKQKDFEKNILKFIKRNKIKTIINFAANNNNLKKADNFNQILNSNYNLPISLIKICEKVKTTIFLFLSQDSSTTKYFQNYYSLSKNMLYYYLISNNFKTKVRVLNINSTFGPRDKNLKRLVPSLMIKLIINKVKINLNQKKNLIYVKDLNKEIVKLFNFKKKFIYKKIKGKNYDIYEVYKYLKNLERKNNIKNKNYDRFYDTYIWYKKNYKI